ncbi:hypothetical protein ACP4OV_016689 [Aristida adscensionis]
MAEAEDADGDRVIEVVSAGALFRGGDWERKYWSCSRGKDRLFGFKNASVQRLLRELIIDSTAVELKLPSAITSDPVSPSEKKNSTDVSDAEDLPICLNKTGGSAKRSIKPSQVEGAAKRVHYQDVLTSADNCDKYTNKTANEGGPVGRALLQDVSDSGCILPFPEEIPGTSKYATVDDSCGESPLASSQHVGSSSGSYLSPQKSDLESAEKEVAKSMLSILLPEAIPLLKKRYKKKKSKKTKQGKFDVSGKTVSAQSPSDDGCQGLTMPATIGEGNRNGSEIDIHGRSVCGMVNDCTNDDCTNNEPMFKLDEIKDFVADSFEDDEQIWGENTSKRMDTHHHESDDACSRDPVENTKLPRDGHTEISEFQVGSHNSTETPDVVYDHEKGQYILSESLLACLEEEFGGQDSSYAANYSQCNNDIEQMQVEQQFKDPKHGINNGPPILTAVPAQNSICNRLTDDFAHSSARHGSAVLSSGECQAGCINTNEWLGKVEECQAGCTNGNGNTVMSVKSERIVCHHQSDHALSSICLRNGRAPYNTTSARGSDNHLELVGCYLHQMPVLSIMLNSKNSKSLYIYVLCGFMENCQRFLYVYNVTTEDQQVAPPCFIGYAPLLLPSPEQSSTGNFTFGRSGLQFTPDGRFLVLLSSVRIPFCRMQRIDCSCSMCKLNQHEDNSLKIVSVNSGYVSIVTKLRPYGTVSCILICEPNYIVAAEDSRNLHIWMMVNGWSGISEEYMIPSLGNMGPSILELRRMSEGSSLIIGHDGAGGFCLWDISKRTLLATFAAPGNIVSQILPVGFCSLQEDIIHAPVDDIEKRLQEITVSDMSRKNGRESFPMPPRGDIAVWLLVSSASVAEYQHDLRAKEHNARWRLALLAKKRIFIGNILDQRATAVDTYGDYGFAGTCGGELYTWELSSGRKLAGTQSFNRGRVSCVAVDAKSGLVAVADDGCQLLLYTQNKVLSDVGGTR